MSSELLMIPPAAISRETSDLTAGMYGTFLPRATSVDSRCGLPLISSWADELEGDELQQKVEHYLPFHHISDIEVEDRDYDESDKPIAREDSCSNSDAASLADTSISCEDADIEAYCDSYAEEYFLRHCQIRPIDLKSTALMRIHELHELFCEMQTQGVVNMICSIDDDMPDSIFGFSRITVQDVARFNDYVKKMVLKDAKHCWIVNGRRNMAQPTGAVYELLRQLGIHPVKGTRDAAPPSKCSPSVARDFMLYTEYKFTLQRLRKNCSRLKIGVIGNRRQ